MLSALRDGLTCRAPHSASSPPQERSTSKGCLTRETRSDPGAGPASQRPTGLAKVVAESPSSPSPLLRGPQGCFRISTPHAVCSCSHRTQRGTGCPSDSHSPCLDLRIRSHHPLVRVYYVQGTVGDPKQLHEEGNGGMLSSHFQAKRL